ncbi:unnamed protein product [Penicillium salamii]|nr:unnamed protein product [Penicillium salamii]CAG8298906.1 unnamed protein product [Penicillium salamii]CAG8401499.1 unnamed protein product [Penicillium salamii]
MSKVARVPVRTERAPLPPPFLSQGLVVGDVVYCSGQVGADPTTGTLVEGSIQNRTRQILNNLSAVLEAGGSSLHDAIKVNIFLTDMADFPAVNEVYATFFSDPKPVSEIQTLETGVRTCVSVKSLPLGTDVEIECSGLVTKSGNGRSSRL